MKFDMNDFKKWLQAEEIAVVENGIYIKFSELGKEEFKFICEYYEGKALSDTELIMPNKEYEILIEVYKDSLIKWN